MKRYIKNDHIKSYVLDIIKQMYKDNWRPDYIVGITRGGLYPAIMLSHYLDIKMYTLDVRLRDGIDSPESNYWMAENAYGIFQQGVGYESTHNILIMDDINDTGATFQWIVDDWQKSNDAVVPTVSVPTIDMPVHNHKIDRWKEVWHKNVRFAALVNNLSSEFDVDYSSLEINKKENPEWIVFPYEEWW